MTNEYRMISKSEIAKMIGISVRTLSYLLNVRFYEKMVSMDYSKRQKQLTPAQVRWLDKELAFWENDINEYKMTSKSKIAKMIGISTRTLNNMLNVRFYEKMVLMGYYKLQKKLTPAQVRWLDKELVFREYDDCI